MERYSKSVRLLRRLVPSKDIRQGKARILQMKHATMMSTGGPAGSMKQQWPHQKRIAGRGHAEKLGLFSPEALDCLGRESTHAMGSSQHSKSPIRCVGVVEMKPYCQHPFEQLYGRLDVRNAFLDAPRTEARRLNAVAKGEG